MNSPAKACTGQSTRSGQRKMTGHGQLFLSKAGDRPTMKNAIVEKHPKTYIPAQIRNVVIRFYFGRAFCR